MIEKAPAEKMGDPVVPQIRPPNAQSSGFFSVEEGARGGAGVMDDC